MTIFARKINVKRMEERIFKDTLRRQCCKDDPLQLSVMIDLRLLVDL